MSELYTKSWLDQHEMELPEWQQQAFQSLRQMLTQDTNPYPCIPGKQGFISDHLRFGFVGDPSLPSTAKEISLLLKKYGQCSTESGKYTSLVVFTQPALFPKEVSVEQFEEIFWELLNHISQHDHKEWPSHISSDPTHASWEFCFDGNPYFTFCATPAHVTRLSRHFPSLLLAFQPRWVFEKMNDSTPFGRKIKQAIRSRLLKYDGIPAHPSLNWYGHKDNLEWKQYFLRDDDQAPSKCPFTRMKQALSKIHL